MNNIVHETGSILNYFGKDTYICHQCNCVTNYPAGLSKFMFNKYPCADTYKNRIKKSIPGTIEIFNIPETVNVVNMYGQYLPGKHEKSYPQKNRLVWFKQCLKQLANALEKTNCSIENAKPSNTLVVFPKNIGCGLAGGKWTEYFNAIESFAADLNLKVIIVTLE